MSEAPRLDLLNLFIAVAESSSFSVAAKKLGLTKSKVSRGVTRLEADLGAQLLHRTTRSVGLTTAGAELFTRVAPHLSALRTAVASLPGKEEVPSGELRITTTLDFGVAYLADVVARFTIRYPHVRVTTTLSNAYVDLVAEGIDLAFRAATRPLKDSTLVARKIAAMEMHLYASPVYLSRRGQPKSLEQLGEHDWVTAAGLLASVGIDVPVARERIVADHFLYLREALRSGAGIGALPTLLCQEDLKSGTLVRVLPKWTKERGVLYLVQPRVQHVPLRVRAFKDFLLEQFAARPLMPR